MGSVAKRKASEMLERMLAVTAMLIASFIFYSH